MYSYNERKSIIWIYYCKNIYIFANNNKHPVLKDVSVCNKPV